MAVFSSDLARFEVVTIKCKHLEIEPKQAFVYLRLSELLSIKSIKYLLFLFFVFF